MNPQYQECDYGESSKEFQNNMAPTTSLIIPHPHAYTVCMWIHLLVTVFKHVSTLMDKALMSFQTLQHLFESESVCI